MFESGLILEGVLLFFIGLAFLLITFLILRVVPSIRPNTKTKNHNFISPDLSTHQDAVLVVRSGGWVSYLNDQARVWFGIKDERPNLENMACNTRPADTFLRLCAAEGQARFSINGQWVEGASYAYPGDNEKSILISLRPEKTIILNKEETDFPKHALDILMNFSQTMATDLRLETTLQAILASVEQLIPTDFAEVTILDTNNQCLIPYRFVGPEGRDLHLEKTDERYKLGEGFSGFIAETLEPLLIGNIDDVERPAPIIDLRRYPFQAYLGIPLLIGGALIGTLELASHSANAYSENDLELLRFLGSQAAITLNNALLYQDEQRRADELTNLAKLTQAIHSTRNLQDLFSNLVEGISPLLDSEIIGFLIYNHNTQILKAQQPFIGVPQNFVDLYHVSIPQDSPAESVWKKQDAIIATNATTDQRLIDLGIDHPSRAAGIRNTILYPLKSSGRPLGYLQVANKRDGLPYDADDLRILSIVTGQAAPMIENADLIQQSMQRARRAEAMRRIASLSGSAANLDEILKYSILELARLLQADYAGIFLLDENLSELRIHKESVYGTEANRVDNLFGIRADDPDFRDSFTHNQQTYLYNNTDEDMGIPPVYRALIQKLQIKSAIAVPIIIHERGLGEIILGSQQAEFFIQSDIQLASTVASQLSVAIERSTLVSQSDVKLRKRVEQLTALTRISRELNTSVELHHLLKRVYEEAIQTAKADCGTILLFSLSEDQVDTDQIVAYFGEKPDKSRYPLEKKVLESGKYLMIADFDAQTKDNFEGVLSPPHKFIRTSLVIPIAYQERVVGLIHLHSKTAGIFDNVSIEIVQALAVHAAIAVGNAKRYQDQVHQTELLNRRVDALSNIFEASRKLHLEQPLKKTLEDIARGIQSSTEFDVVLISVFDLKDKRLHRISNAGLSSENMQKLQARPQPWENIAKLMSEEFRFGRSYFIPYDRRPDMPESWHSITVMDDEPFNGDQGKWHPDDILIAPLLTPDGSPLGLISIDSPRNQLRPDHFTIETLEIFASQAALVIESQHRMVEVQTEVYELAKKLGQTERVQQEYPRLVEQNRDKNTAIENLKQFSQRLTAGLSIIETINVQHDRLGILSSLGAELQNHLGLDITLIAESNSSGSHLLQVVGKIPDGVNPEALFGQRNPVHQSLQSMEIILVNNIEESSEWQNSPLLTALNAQSLICLPVKSQSGWQAAVMGLSHQKQAPFTQDDEYLFQLISRQTGAAVNNLDLLTETGQRLREVNLLLEFSHRLGGLGTKDILKTLLSSVFEILQTADTGIVTLIDTDRDLLLSQATKGYTNEKAIAQVVFSSKETITGQVHQQRRSVRLDDVNFTKDYNLVLSNLINYRDATGGKLPVSSMLIPIQSRKNNFGIIILENFERNSAFSAEDQALVESLARQTALSLENVQLIHAAEERAAQLQALSDVAAKITSSLEPEPLLDSLLDSLKPVVPFDAGFVWLRDGDTLTIQSAQGFSDGDNRVGNSIATDDNSLFSEMIQTNQPIGIDDVRTDGRFPVAMTDHLSWLGVPMMIKGEVTGFITLEKAEAGFYNFENIQAANTFASQAAVALENATLFTRTRRLTETLEQRVAERTDQLGYEHRRAQTLLQIMQELSASLDLDHVLNRTLSRLNETIGAQQSTILLVRPEDKTFYHRAAVGYTIPPPIGGRSSALPRDDGLASWVINHREGVLIDDLSTDPRWIEPPEGSSDHRSAIAVPLMVGAEALGSMLLFHRRPGTFSAEQQELVQAASNQIAVAINNNELFNLIREQAESLGSMLRTQQVEASRSMAILEAVADGVLVTDSQNEITLFNQSAQQILNLDRNSVVSQSLDAFTGLFGSAARPWMETIHEWANNPADIAKGDMYAERITLDNDRVVSIHLAPVVMRNEFLGTVSIFRDISHQVAVDRLKSEFVATVSHELRTPMTSIKGYVDVLLMGAAGALNDQQASFLQVVKTNTERLNILVNDLLDVSRIEAGKVTLSYQPLDISEIAGSVLEEQLQQSKKDGKNMNVDLEVASNLPRVPGDQERVRQILGNLINNAFNYTPDGGGIKVNASVIGDEVQIDIIDNGIGIKPEDSKRIFERFYRGEDPMVLASPGNGLGLAITQQLIEMHHGRIWMKSSGVPGEGSIFSFTLPQHVQDDETQI